MVDNCPAAEDMSEQEAPEESASEAPGQREWMQEMVNDAELLDRARRGLDDTLISVPDDLLSELISMRQSLGPFMPEPVLSEDMSVDLEIVMPQIESKPAPFTTSQAVFSFDIPGESVAKPEEKVESQIEEMANPETTDEIME